MKSFKHSGALGDLLYALPIVKHFGGGKLYLHLDQLNWIGQHYYGSPPDPFHRGRMTESDYEFIKDFILAQDYITDFEILDPASTMITHNLDRFRPLFVRHPSNYVNTYCMAFGINDQEIWDRISSELWFSVPQPKKITGKRFVINRSLRGFTPPGLNPFWTQWHDQQNSQDSVFVGLPEEHTAFEQLVGWKVDYQPTKTLLEVAEIIAACEQFIGNQSMALALAQGLGVPYAYETRRDLPTDRNESYFPNHSWGKFF